MTIKKCKFGFDCSLMMMQPFITVEECENFNVCGTVEELTDEELKSLSEIIRVSPEKDLSVEIEKIVKQNSNINFVCKNKDLIHQFKQLFKSSLKNSNEYSFTFSELHLFYFYTRDGIVSANKEFDFFESINSIESLCSEIFELLDEQKFLIPPRDTVVSKYNVKQNGKVYEYWQLMASLPIFKAVFSEKQKFKVPMKKHGDKTTKIHLGKEKSPKYLLITSLILKRQNISIAFTKIKNALELLKEAFDLLKDIRN